MSKLKKSLAVVVGATGLWAAPANAAALLFDEVGDSATVNFDGYTNPGNPVYFDGLTAQLQLTLSAINGSTFEFDYTLINTSTGDHTGSRVSRFGFDTDPDVSSASITGAFTETYINDNFPNTAVEICFAPTQQGSCTGGPGGVTVGNDLSGSLFLTFAQPITEVTVSNLHVRYQQVGIDQEDSGLGDGQHMVVPEPATWMMLLIGFFGIGAVLRRREREVSAQFA